MNLKKLSIFIVIFIFFSFLSMSNADTISDPEIDYWDFGDNPDIYQTLLASDGARHIDGTREWLGQTKPDYETDGQPSDMASLDDNITPTGGGPDDEDGVAFFGTYRDAAGTQLYDPNIYWGGLYGKIDIEVSVSQYDSIDYGPDSDQLLYIDGWIDWTHDGDFADDGTFDTGPNSGMAWDEHIISFTADPSTWGQNSMIFTETFLNGWGPEGPFYARFRVNYGEGVNPSFGEKIYGEVEDYGGLGHAQKPIPEPSTLFLLGLGLIGFAGWRRKKLKSNL